MINSTWNSEDIDKLRRNIRRPMLELRGILKNKYSDKDISHMKKELLKESIPVKRRKSKFPEEVFKILYDNYTCPFKILCKKYPEVKEHANSGKIYFGYIKSEIKGIQTMLPQNLYDLIKLWYNTSHVETLPQRGSAGIRKNCIKSAIKNAKDKPLQTSLIEKDSDVLEKIASQFTKKAEFKIGLYMGDELKLLCDSTDQAKGATLVLKKLGFENYRLVKLLMEEF